MDRNYSKGSIRGGNGADIRNLRPVTQVFLVFLAYSDTPERRIALITLIMILYYDISENYNCIYYVSYEEIVIFRKQSVKNCSR